MRIVGLLLLICLLAAKSYGQITWDGGAGTTNWADGNNWSPNGTPGAGDDVVIDAGDVVVLSTAIGVTLDDITIQNGGSLEIATGGSLSTDNAGGGQGWLYITNGGILNVTGGSLSIGDYATIEGATSQVNVSSGTLDVDEQFSVNGSTVTLSGGTLETGNNGGHYAYFYGGATFNMTGGDFGDYDLYVDGATIDIDGGTIALDDLYAYGTSTIDIDGGDFTIDDMFVYGDADLDFDGNSLSADFIEVQGNGDLDLSSGTVTTNYIGAFNNSTLSITTTVTSNSDATWADFYIWDSATVNIGDGADISGFTDLNIGEDWAGDGGNSTLNITGGSFAVEGDWDIDGSTGDQINISGGTISAGGDINVGDSDISVTMTGGTLDAGSFTDTDNSGGEVSDNFGLTAPATVTSGGNQVLPVDLIFFSGKFGSNVISLEWATASELNNERFEIYKSYDGAEFELIGSIEGAGTTATKIDYAFEDRLLKPERIYYQLKQIDYDGRFEMFDIITIDASEFVQSASLNIYPNPITDGIVNLELKGVSELKAPSAFIYNNHGLVVQKIELSKTNANWQFESDLPAGNYVIKLVFGSKSITKRLIFQ